MYKLLALSLLPLSVLAMSPEMRIASSSLMAPRNTSLTFDGHDFIVERDGQRSFVNRAYVNPKLRNMTPAKLAALQKHGYLKLNQMDEGYSLDAFARGKGGGFYTGWLFYTVTKSSLYGLIAGGAAAAAVVAAPAAAGAVTTAAAAAVAGAAVPAGVAGTATASVIATNAAAAVALGASSAAAAALPGAAVAGATATTLGVGGGAAVLGAAQTGLAVAGLAGEGVALTVAAGTAAMAAIEVASLSAGAVGTSIVWLP